ncbi:MAG: hypothetical protein NVS2B16_01980 [Chloroflexota bacterium]
MQCILVADDDDDIRRLIVFTLTRRGYMVLEADNGDMARDLIARERPDLVVLDVTMPQLSGIQVARALRADAQTAHIPIVMLSAAGQTEDIDRGLAAGAFSYLLKPFLPSVLATHVAVALEQANKARSLKTAE